MLQELFLLEEERRNLGMLFLLGAVAGLIGFLAAYLFFPSRLAVISVVFASVPLIFSLTKQFMKDEENDVPHVPEIKMYFAIFAGETSTFFSLAMFTDASFGPQRTVLGLSSSAVSDAGFQSVLMNNLGVFFVALLLALVIGSAGAFVLTWNASVLGVFLAEIASTDPFLALSYIPHASLEMIGFITAGLSGTLVSAAIYRKDFSRDRWMNYVRLILLGLLFVLLGAFVETA